MALTATIYSTGAAKQLTSRRRYNSTNPPSTNPLACPDNCEPVESRAFKIGTQLAISCKNCEAAENAGRCKVETSQPIKDGGIKDGENLEDAEQS
eukprot:scaffold216350_cov25-Prasinocladus_malaysianus.AAC.1